jgi:hypothetical protein
MPDTTLGRLPVGGAFPGQLDTPLEGPQTGLQASQDRCGGRGSAPPLKRRLVPAPYVLN